MSGRLVGAFILISALAAGIAVYYFQVYAFYHRVPAAASEVRLTETVTGMAEPVPYQGFEAIDADSSPLRYRACFDLAASVAALRKTYVLYDRPVPLEAPGWFDCFDADEIGAALASGEATAFLGEENVVYGVDRVVAVFRDGRARSWHQINRCGEEVFDGRPPPPGCPPAPAPRN